MTRRSTTRTEPTSSRPATGAERRTHVRYVCRMLLALLREVGKPRETESVARIVDLSRGGLSLLVKHKFEAGTNLDVTLLTPLLPRTLGFNVLHVSAIEKRSWLLGGAFTTPLSSEELAGLSEQSAFLG